MKNIKLTLWGSLLLLTFLWLSVATFPEKWGYFNFRFLMNQYSGTIAMGAMSLCMLLAIRPIWLEKALQGLDKGYRLHKWLGITALVATLIHFWFTKGTKWMVGWGWIERPNRQRPNANLLEGFSIEQWLGGFRKTAETVGEWAFYFALIWLIAALVKRIPYHWFKKLHKWFAVMYLAFVFHTIVLFKFDYWLSPLGGVIATLLLVGTVSAIIVLTKKIGSAQKIQGRVSQITFFPESDIYELTIDVPKWRGHKAGQFAFFKHSAFTEAHPFTIASAQAPLRILVKNLGDDTARLSEKIKVGDVMEIEGAYGCFDFNDNAESQIWVAAGVGITPFIARLEWLQEQKTHQNITLFYSFRNANQALLVELQQRATLANVQLVLWDSHKQGRLSATDIHPYLVNNNYSLWFCGNSEFGKQLSKELNTKQFHQELFEMR